MSRGLRNISKDNKVGLRGTAEPRNMKDYLLQTSSQVKEVHITYIKYHKNKYARITWNLKEPVSRSPEESGVFRK